MRDILDRALQPLHLDIVNDSGRHAGHGGDDGSGETHYRVTIASSRFDALGRIARQRLVYELLADEFVTGLHALSVKALSGPEYDRV